MTLDSLLIAYGSVLILPLAVVEGPLVSVAAGLLSAQGYFDWPWVVTLLVCGDVIGDQMYYWLGRSFLGRSGNGWLARLLGRFDGRMSVPADLQARLRGNATKMLLIGKWTQSVGAVVLIAAGMLRVPLGKYVIVNLLATIPKTLLIFAVGYLAGQHLGMFEDHALLASTVLAILGIGGILFVLRRGRGFGVGGAGP